MSKNEINYKIYNLIDENINLQIHCSVYKMNSQRGKTDLPKCWITLEKEIIFDYPKQFLSINFS